ncbi:hypothetical protein BGX34_007998 [Mortierella sp. NVP85]|nr:hypothetical protein BGX34_007998 [Mortierella sp. NVP85]
MPATSTTYTKVEKITDAEAVKQAYVPTHLGKFAVEYAEGDYNSKLVASQSYKKGEIICQIEGTSPGPKRYTSVQVGRDAHIELNSDLVFMNHSCSPSIILDTEKLVVIAAVDLKEGDNLTFFYPSTEWEMTQPFPCWCDSEQCIKVVQGAKYLSKDAMSQQPFVSKHIQELMAERDGSPSA